MTLARQYSIERIADRHEPHRHQSCFRVSRNRAAKKSDGAEQHEPRRPWMPPGAIWARGAWLAMSQDEHRRERKRIARDKEERSESNYPLERAGKKEERPHRAARQERRTRRAPIVHLREETRRRIITTEREYHARGHE